MPTPQPIVIGGTYNWLLTATINTEAAPTVFGLWDITGATVTISFLPPSGAGQHFSATVLASKGQARYINGTTLFDTAGEWGMSWKVSLSGTVLESQVTNFTVYPSGAAL